jgi:hypothetical protein
MLRTWNAAAFAATVGLILGLGWAVNGDVQAQDGTGIKLFNGKDLAGWKKFVDPRAKDADPNRIWTVRDGVIICEGNVYGYIVTEKEYDNYVLQLEWRWGEKKVGQPGNSGVFVHVSGEDKIWPKGVEAQLQNGRAGDFWLVDGFKLQVDPARRDPKVDRHYFRLKDDVEKPLGQWNHYEITCRGDTVKLVINGHLVNEGTGAELTKGKILLQSEGAEIHFRNVQLKPIQ